MTHNTGASIDKARDGTINWTFTGDLLVCLVGGDGWTRLSEYRTKEGKRNLIFRRHLPSEVAVKIADDFEGEVVWK